MLNVLRRKYNLEVRVYFTGRIVRDKKTEWLQLGTSDKLTMCKNSIWPGYLQKDGHFWSCQKLIEVVILNIWIFSMFPKAGRNFIFNKMFIFHETLLSIELSVVQCAWNIVSFVCFLITPKTMPCGVFKIVLTSYCNCPV